MSDAPKPNPSLAEISHLFLSSVRERQTAGSPKPVRRPPGRAQTVDLTPEELAQVIQDDPAPLKESEQSPVAPVSAIVAGQLNGPLVDRARAYAAQLARSAGRVGLIQIDSAEFRVTLYESDAESPATGPPAPPQEGFDARRMTETLEELAWDVDRWLVVLTSARSQEARSLLRKINHWVLLSTSDAESVVTCYRTLKGLSELHRPRLSVAFLDAPEKAEAQKAFRKLNGVAQQFLGWNIELENPVVPVKDVAEHQVAAFCGSHDKAQLAAAPQWEIVGNFVSRSSPLLESQASVETQQERATPSPRRHVVDISIPEPAEATAVAMPAAPAMKISGDTRDGAEVYDLPNGDGSSGNITGAILSSRGGELIECPLKPPMCPEARLAVRRDRRLVLLAVARQGLSDLRSIGQAYQWMVQNRPLIAMALPQLSIDVHQMPMLDLLVDHNDMSADILQPMLQSEHVTVHAYRKLRWGERTGLLLEAA